MSDDGEIVDEPETDIKPDIKVCAEDILQNSDAMPPKQEDDEDVPEDFFDDFSKEDFMAGLDIVDDDEWDENSQNPNSEVKRERRERPPRRPSLNDKRRKEYIDSRRDPVKTKRAIQDYKVKCAKDKEKKLISTVLETGLVPPGMEMEEMSVNNGSEDRRRRSSDHKLKIEHKTKSRSRDRRLRRSRSKSYERRIRMSPYRRRSSPNPIRKTSRSPLMPKIPRRHSPAKAMMSRNISPPRYSPNRRSPNYRRARGTAFRREFSYSPGRRRKRSHSRSPHKRSKHEDKKISFLQEIAEKLNQTSSSGMQMQQQIVQQPQQMMYQSQMIPQPVPPPAAHPFNQYEFDQQFFIGNQNCGPPLNNYIPPHLPEYTIPEHLRPTNHNQMHPLSIMPTESSPVSSVNSPAPMAVNNAPVKQKEPVKVNKAAKTSFRSSRDNLVKLLDEKKISLSEYLSITAKVEANSAAPIQLTEKIKVISRCQDALKFFAGGKMFSGRLIVKPVDRPARVVEKYSSPLTLVPNISLPFTTPSQEAPKKSYLSMLNQVLTSAGIVEGVGFPAKPRTSAPVMIEQPPPAPTISKLKTSKPSSFPPPPKEKRMLMKMVQTDSFKCVDCEKRKRQTYSQVGVQCGTGGVAMVHMATQVSEDDIIISPRKKQSFASFTPAQLLGRSGNPVISPTRPGDHRNLSREEAESMGMPSIFPMINAAPLPTPFGNRVAQQRNFRQMQNNNNANATNNRFGFNRF